MFIVGGLLAFGVLALVGSIFLAIGEEKKATTKTASPTPTPQETAEPAIPSKTSADSAKLPALREEAQLTLIGQTHELAAELRTIHERVAELNERLGALTEVANRIERAQGNYVRVEEDYTLYDAVEASK